VAALVESNCMAVTHGVIVRKCFLTVIMLLTALSLGELRSADAAISQHKIFKTYFVAPGLPTTILPGFEVQESVGTYARPVVLAPLRFILPTSSTKWGVRVALTINHTPVSNAQYSLIAISASPHGDDESQQYTVTRYTPQQVYLGPGHAFAPSFNAVSSSWLGVGDPHSASTINEPSPDGKFAITRCCIYSGVITYAATYNSGATLDFAGLLRAASLGPFNSPYVSGSVIGALDVSADPI
jgi:hypothetical protein